MQKKVQKKQKTASRVQARQRRDKQELALFLLFVVLVKVRKLGLFGKCDLFVRVCLVVELKGVVGVCEVLSCLIFNHVVGGYPVEELWDCCRTDTVRGSCHQWRLGVSKMAVGRLR